MIGLLLICREINQFKFIRSSRLCRWTNKTGIPVFFVHLSTFAYSTSIFCVTLFFAPYSPAFLLTFLLFCQAFPPFPSAIIPTAFLIFPVLFSFLILAVPPRYLSRALSHSLPLSASSQMVVHSYRKFPCRYLLTQCIRDYSI